MRLLGHFCLLLSTFFVSPLWYTGRGWSAISYRSCYELLLLLHASECPMIWLFFFFFLFLPFICADLLHFITLPFVQPFQLIFSSPYLNLLIWFYCSPYADNLLCAYSPLSPRRRRLLIYISISQQSNIPMCFIICLYHCHLPPYLQVLSTTQFLILNKYNLSSIIPDDFSLKLLKVLGEYRMANNRYLVCR